MSEIKIYTDEPIGYVHAKICLLIAAQYAEENGLKIVGDRLYDGGKVVYWFEERRR